MEKTVQNSIKRAAKRTVYTPVHMARPEITHALLKPL